MSSRSKKVDRGRRFADGGKVRVASRIKKLLAESPQFALHRWIDKQGLYPENTPLYDEILSKEQWDPDMSEGDLRHVFDYYEGFYDSWNKDQVKRLDDLIKKHGIRPRNYNTWRGLELDPDYAASLRSGDKLTYDLPSSTSVSKDIAEVFANRGEFVSNSVPTLMRIAPNERLALPVPLSGHSELVMPSGEAGRLFIDKVRRKEKGIELDVEAIGPHPGFAGGGKVKTLQQLKRRLIQAQGRHGYNSPEYLKLLQEWNPDLGKEDLALMEEWAGSDFRQDWDANSPQTGRMNELIKKFGIRPSLPTYSGVGEPESVIDSLKPGDLFPISPHLRSVSTDLDVAKTFLDHYTMGNQTADKYPTLLRVAPSRRKALPVPQSGESELLMPSGGPGRLAVDRLRYVKDRGGYFEVEVDPVPHPGFADGGQVLPSSQDEEEPWSDTYIKRPLSGLASMWGGTDPETGEFVSPAIHNIKRAWGADERRRQDLPPQKRATLGIVDETVSLPALGGIVGLPVPEFASEAEERASTTREAAREAIGVDAPHGFTENIAESAGVMAGQLPVPASIANKLKILKTSGKLGKAGKVLGPAAEWFSPTVVPKASNYIKGTLFGGVLGGGLDYLTDYMDEKEEKERHKQFISEAIAEVLEEERVKAAQESGDETSDDEALAELGYAEGGRVKQAKKAIGSLRQILSEADPEDVNTRKAAIDQALNAIKGTVGPTEMDRRQLHTMAGGLSDAVADAVPERRRQRFGDYENSVLNLLERRVAPTLTEQPVPDILPAAPADMPARTQIPIDDPHVRLDKELGPMDPSTSYNPAKGMDNRHGVLTQEEWERMMGIKRQFATGGGVGVDKRDPVIPAPQSQKDEMAATLAAQAGPARTGAPLSQEWFENYGAGPEHLFLGDRTIKLHDYWGPQHPGAVPPPQQGQAGSWLPGVGIVGLALYDEWKKKRGEGQDASQQAFWNDMHASAANTTDTDAWVNQQLDEYGTNAPMPVMGEDGSISYVQPNQFWSDMHRSASNTANTDAWVNDQLENYGSSMPVMNEDGTISYVGSDGKPATSGGLDMGRAWQGAGGAYDIYSGLNRGDAGGYIQAYQGAGDLYGALTGQEAGALGQTGDSLGGLYGMYSGIEQGGVQGYTQAAGGALQTANTLGINTGAMGAAAGKAIPLIGAAMSAYGAYESAKVGDKKGAVAQGAAAGAAVGSVIPVVGTAIGAVVGALVGLVGASLGDKQQASEAYYGAHKNLKADEQIRGWSEDQVNGAVFETIKSHTKSGNVNKYKDVGEMYTAFGITKDAHKNYKNVQGQMGDFIKGVVQTAQQMGSLPTDPAALKQLDGQQIYYKVIVPAIAAKYKEATGKDSEGWTVDKVTAGSNSKMHALMADWTDWMTSHWGEAEAKAAQKAELQASRVTRPGDSGLGMGRTGGGRMLERARGGRVQNFDDDTRFGALSALR